MNPTCQLIDAAKRHTENPQTFLLPPKAALESLVPGLPVKIGVEGFSGFLGRPVGAERFWVRLTIVDDILTGIVEQADMIFTHHHGIAHGDTVIFNRDNILEVGDGTF